MIVVTERCGKNKELLAMENVDKTTMAEVAKVSSAIDLEVSIVRQLAMLT